MRCQQWDCCRQQAVEQTKLVGRCAAVRQIFLFRPHCFGRFQQHAKPKASRLDRGLQYASLVSKLSLVYQFLLSSVASVLCVILHPSTTTSIIDLVKEVSQMFSTVFMVFVEQPALSHMPLMTIAIPMHEWQISSTIGKSSKNVARILQLELDWKMRRSRRCEMLLKPQSRCMCR